MNIVQGFCSLVKSQQHDDSNNVYTEELNRIGLDTTIIPALSFQYINKDELLHCVKQTSNYSGLVLTSPRAVESITQALDQYNEVNKEQILSHWRRKRNFSVGEATAEAAATSLQLSCLGQTSGSAESLIPIILKYKDSLVSPLLYPCSNLAKVAILSLQNHGIQIHKMITYETIAHPLLKESVETIITNKGIPEIWVCFSPSGVKALLPILSELNVPLDTLKFIAIGSTTSNAYQQNNIIPWCVAQKPNAQSLAESILKAKNS